MESYLIDTHAHLDYFSDQHLAKILQDARKVRVKKVITVSDSLQSCQRNLEIAGSYENIWVALGVHPHMADKVNQNHLLKLEKLLDNSKVVAVGEIGLDFYRQYSDKSKQVWLFKEQLNLAKTKGIPVIVHCRQAYEEVESILREFNLSIPVIIHCFSGNSSQAAKFINLGCFISFSGIASFPSAEAVRDAATVTPLSKMLVETDSPYLAPVPYRGRENQPAYLTKVVEVIAGKLNLDLVELVRQTSRNAESILGL